MTSSLPLKNVTKIALWNLKVEQKRLNKLITAIESGDPKQADKDNFSRGIKEAERAVRQNLVSMALGMFIVGLLVIVGSIQG